MSGSLIGRTVDFGSTDGSSSLSQTTSSKTSKIMEQKKAVNLMVLFAIVIFISTYVYVKSVAKSFEIKQLPPETEMQKCLRETNSDGSDEECEWCNFLLTDDCRQIDTIILVWEGEPLFGVGFTDGKGYDFLNLYELQQITKHSKSNI